jgi:peptide/nickel transport system permease protein
VAIDTALEAVEESPVAQRRPLLRRLGRHKMGLAGLAILACLVLVALAAPAIAPYHPNEQTDQQLAPPTLSHPFGTDHLGRDVFSRVVFGARISLGVAFTSVAIGVSGAVFLGLVCGYMGGWVDYALQRIAEVFMAFPLFILLIIVAAALGPSIRNVILILGIAIVPPLSRLFRAVVLGQRDQQYVEAARCIGASEVRVMVRHVLPGLLPLALVMASMLVGFMVLAEAALSFLGLGVPPPNPAWGADLSGSARQYFREAPWIAIFPGLGLTLTVTASTMLGEAVRDVADPRLRSHLR